MADISKIKLNSTNYNVKDATARSSISTINTTLNTLSSKVTAMESNQYIEQTELLTFGDSFGNDPGDWSYLLADMMGLNLHCYNESGGLYPFSTQIVAAASDFSTDALKRTIKLAIVYGGINNVAGNAVADGTMVKNFITNFRDAFPDVPLYVAPMNICDVNFTTYPNAYRNAMASVPKILEDLEGYNKEFFLMQDSWMFNLGDNNYFSSDHLHPSALGSKVIAERIYEYINGSYNPECVISAFGTIPTGITVLDSCIATPQGIYTPTIEINPATVGTGTYQVLYFRSSGFFIQPDMNILKGVLKTSSARSVKNDIAYVYSDPTSRQFYMEIYTNTISNISSYQKITIPRQFVAYGLK